MELSTFSTMKARATPPSKTAHQPNAMFSGMLGSTGSTGRLAWSTILMLLDFNPAENAGFLEFLQQAIIEVAAGFNVAAQNRVLNGVFVQLVGFALSACRMMPAASASDFSAAWYSA